MSTSISVDPKNKPGSHPALAYRPQDYMATAQVGPLLYPTTTTAGWTVVHHGTLGPPREPYVAPRRAQSATRNLPISGSSSSAVPTVTPARPLPVPPPLDSVSVGSTTFTRRPQLVPDNNSSKGKRRASISVPIKPLAIPPSTDAPASASAISPSSNRPLPPLPPPVASGSSSSSNQAQAGPSGSRSKQQTQKSPRSTRQHTPDATAFRVANPNAGASSTPTSSYVAPTATRPILGAGSGPSPTLPFDGVSGVWAPRPAADSHSRGVTVISPASTMSRKASPSLSRRPSVETGMGLGRKMSAEALERERERTLRRQASAEQQRIAAAAGVASGQTLVRRASFQRQNSSSSGGTLQSAMKKGSVPSTPASGVSSAGFGAGAGGGGLGGGSGVVIGVVSAKRKSSLPPGVGSGSGAPAPPSPLSMSHSRSPSSSSGSTPINTTKPPPPPPLVTANANIRPRHGHGRAASVSGPLVPLPAVPPPPPLLPYGEVASGSRSVSALVPPPPPPPLVTIRTAATRVAARGVGGGSGSNGSVNSSSSASASSPTSSSSNSPTPSPAAPPLLAMGAVLRAARGSPASAGAGPGAGLHSGGHSAAASGYTASPLTANSTTTPASSTGGAWQHRWGDDGSGYGSGSGSAWSGSGSGYEESPATAATTPASSRDWMHSGPADAAAEKEQLFAEGNITSKRDRDVRRRLHPLEVSEAIRRSVEPGPITPPIHSHPLDEDDGANPESAKDEQGQQNPWLAALEGEVRGDEMNGVLLSPPVFASAGDPDLEGELDDDEMDLYDDGGKEAGFGSEEQSRGREVKRGESRSPSPIRYARRSSVDVDMILSDSSEDDMGSDFERPIGDAASLDSGTLSFNDAKSTFSRTRSVRSLRRRRNTRPPPPPVPLASAAGLHTRRARSRSADSSDGFKEALAPSELWKLEQAAKAAGGPAEMRVVYRARETRLPASIPPPPMPLLTASLSYASLSTTSPSASQSGHDHGGLGSRMSPNTSKSSLPLPRKEGLKLLRREKKDKDKARDKAMRKSSSFSLLRGSVDRMTTSSAEGLVARAYPPERASMSSGGSDEVRSHGRAKKGGGNGGKPALRNYLYDSPR